VLSTKKLPFSHAIGNGANVGEVQTHCLGGGASKDGKLNIAVSLLREE